LFQLAKIINFEKSLEHRASVGGLTGLKKGYRVLVVLTVLVSVAALSVILLTHENEEQPILFQSTRWAKGAAPSEFVDSSTLPFENEIVSVAKTSAVSGPVFIYESDPIRLWVEEII
jgi:hypothetical protein